jgi:serine protease AprX
MSVAFAAAMHPPSLARGLPSSGEARTAAIRVRLVAALLMVVALGPSASAQLGVLNWLPKLDPLLQQRASLLTGRSRIIVRAPDALSLHLATPIVQLAGGVLGRSLPIVNGLVADVPNVALPAIAKSLFVLHISLDRRVVGAMERTGATIGATTVRQDSGYDGSGVGVAIIDSGVAAWHDDLTSTSDGGQRVDRFVDLVNGRSTPYDDYGHGSHVAGIIAGNGLDSGGARSGVAPAARLVVYKALDASGTGRISDVIAALDDIVTHKDTLNIRVVNLSVATGVYESYNQDPLTLAAQRAVMAGIVVVAAAGNNGRGPEGHTRYGGITAPGNAPWVLTVGASSHMGTVARGDDTIAAFSSRGPSAIDEAVKPDVVAPGVGIESLSDPDSAFYETKSPYLLNGTTPTSYKPYLSLSGTSMAAPVVSGTVALMLQANPSLTPNLVKAILEYTAEVYEAYDRFTQGAGFLNAKGAVELARYLQAPSGEEYPASSSWSRQVIWGRRVIQSGLLNADASVWSVNVIWGSTSAPSGWIAPAGGDEVSATTEGDTVVWGTTEGDTVVWGTSCSDPSCQPIVWDNP